MQSGENALSSHDIDFKSTGLNSSGHDLCNGASCHAKGRLRMWWRNGPTGTDTSHGSKGLCLPLPLAGHRCWGASVIKRAAQQEAEKLPEPTWWSEVLFSLPMVTRGAQRPSEGCQSDWKKRKGINIWEVGGELRSLSLLRISPDSEPDDGKCLSLQPHHGKSLWVLFCNMPPRLLSQRGLPLSLPTQAWQQLLTGKFVPESELTPVCTHMHIHKRVTKGSP